MTAGPPPGLVALLLDTEDTRRRPRRREDWGRRVGVIARSSDIL